MSQHSASRRVRASFAIVALCLALVQVVRAAEPRIEEVMVAMRDGTRLATTIYLPAEGDGPWPVVLTRTPYNKDGLAGGFQGFLKNGYACVGQDCRGRFKSEGDYVPFQTDEADGYDTVEWVAAQSWSDGKVGMTGGSATGITTNLAALARPPHLVAGFVVVAPASWREEALFTGGIWRKRMIDGWMAAQQSIAVRDKWVATEPGDAYFDYAEISPRHAEISIPIYNVGGWFDIFAQGSIDNFVGPQTKGGGNARGNQKLIMLALGHGPINARWGKYPNKGDDMGRADVMRWFDYWLKGKNNGIMDEAPIQYFLMGDAEREGAPGNEWRKAYQWPPEPFEETSFYLLPDKTLGSEPPADAESKSAYAYDPNNPAPTRGGANLILPKGPLDQREIGERPDYLRFVGPVLDKPTTAIGRVRVELFVESDAPDTDFMAKLVDVYPDGYEAVILDSGIRMRYREGLDKSVPIVPGKVEKISIDLWSTAYVFDAGHRIAVHATSSNDPRFDPNPNTGAPLRSGDETRVANNAIHHDAEHPSRLVLPIVELDFGPGTPSPDEAIGKLFRRR